MKKFLQANIWIIPLSLLILSGILLSIFGEFSSPSLGFITTLLNSFWFWFVLGILIILIIVWNFRKNLLSKIPGKFNWKWLWSLLGLVVAAWLVWLGWSLIEPIFVTKYAEQHPQQSTTRYRVDPLNGSPDFNTNGRNSMKEGEWYQFTVDWDEPGISYDPIDSDTTLLFFQKSENPTRKWTLKLWKNESGEKEYLWSPIAPVVAVWVGKIYVKCINRSTVVVVSKE